MYIITLFISLRLVMLFVKTHFRRCTGARERPSGNFFNARNIISVWSAACEWAALRVHLKECLMFVSHVKCWLWIRYDKLQKQWHELILFGMIQWEFSTRRAAHFLNMHTAFIQDKSSTTHLGSCSRKLQWKQLYAANLLSNVIISHSLERGRRVI